MSDKLSIEASFELEVMMYSVAAISVLIDESELDDAKEGMTLLGKAMAQFLADHGQLPPMPPLPDGYQ